MFIFPPQKIVFHIIIRGDFPVEFIGISHGSRLISIYLFYMQNDSGIHFIQLLRKEMDVNEHTRDDPTLHLGTH